MNRQAAIIAEIRGLLDELETLGGEPSAWQFPVGSSTYPPPEWYAATLHDQTGALNNGYGHTGIDLNLDHAPWGDIDRGQPVFAVADGILHATDYSAKWLGSIVIEVIHDGAPLWLRYWHLENNTAFRAVGGVIEAGDLLGHIGNYSGGDHLHFDAALDPFAPHWWFTRHPDVRWVDPVDVLKAHLPSDIVDEMLKRR